MDLRLDLLGGLATTTKAPCRIGGITVEVGVIVGASREVPAQVLEDPADEAEVVAVIGLVVVQLALTMGVMIGEIAGAGAAVEAEAVVVAVARGRLITQAHKSVVAARVPVEMTGDMMTVVMNGADVIGVLMAEVDRNKFVWIRVRSC